MSYKPIIYKINSNNFIEKICQFVESWYGININNKMEEINFENIFNIKISNNINKMLNLIFTLNHSSMHGKKLYIYNGFNYIFKCRSKTQCMIYDKKLDTLFLFQEGNQNYYFGIKHENLLENDPPIYKIIICKSNVEYYEYFNLIDFLVYHICTRNGKIGMKSYMLFVENNMEAELKEFEKIFEYKRQFNNFIIFEKENVVASIEYENIIIGNHVKKPILIVNKWKNDDKETENKIINIFNWDGWSDNGRYRL